MKKLIISHKQLTRLDEAVTGIEQVNVGQENQGFQNALDKTPNAGKLAVTRVDATGDANVAIDNPNDIPDIGNAKTVTITADNFKNPQVTSESKVFKKSDIKKIQKNKGEKFTKKEFDKKLRDDYSKFQDNLKNKKEKYGK